jgi:hypothetical protein
MIALCARCLLLACLLSLPLISLAGGADDVPYLERAGDPPPPRCGWPDGRAEADSIYLLGGPGRYDGRFELEDGTPSWQGWLHVDETAEADHWHVSEFQAITGQYSAWCGTYYGDDPGYGNLWDQRLVFVWEVADPNATTVVHWTAALAVDTEEGYDFVYVDVQKASGWETLAQFDGDRLYTVDQTIVYDPSDYCGAYSDEIQLRFRFISDIGYSDEDAIIDTDGACRVDDVVVALDGEVVSSVDFEDGQLHDWGSETLAVGDFSELYQNLQDLDPCASNYSWQVGFIDDGVVVPGTGGTPGQTWRYGPGGYIVNNTGGLVGPEAYVYNRLISPVLEIPAGAAGFELRYDVYLHEGAGDYEIWPGIFITRHIRSTSDPVNDPLETKAWTQTSGWGYGDAVYERRTEDLTSSLVPGAVAAQVSLVCEEAGFYWGWVGTDGTPAPYFDNIAIVAYTFSGPLLKDWGGSSYAIDGFPEIGDLDLGDPANNWVRFDSSPSWEDDEGDIVFVDEIAVYAKAMRDGAVMADPPVMHVAMKANPLFDPVRQLPPELTQTGDLVTGQIEMWPGYDGNDPPQPIEDRFVIDLPDTGFFFPGDVVHYYFEAHDELAGDVGMAILPADTTGFLDFGSRSPYPERYQARALPSLHGLSAGDQPSVLVWADVERDRPQWRLALAQLGWRLGVDYDWFQTILPGTSFPNGLGCLATSATMNGYDTLVYHSGHFSLFTLQLRDVELLDNWFHRGDKRALLVGDNLVSGMMAGGPYEFAFINDYVGVSLLDSDASGHLGGQRSPDVRAVSGTGFVSRLDRWLVYGGCPEFRSFDAVAPFGSTVSICEFLDSNGNSGDYPFVAGVYHLNSETGAQVVLLPYDLSRVTSAPDTTPPDGLEGVTARAIVLEDLLEFLGEFVVGDPIATPPVDKLSVRTGPNPFNPRTIIELSLPRTSDVTIAIYSVRGERLRTLVDDQLDAGEHRLVWDGTTDSGRPVSSGVYFCQTRAGSESRLSKLTLVR